MKNIILVRHGEINNPDKIFYGQNIDLRLNKSGKVQIEKLAHKIAGLGISIDKIHASNLHRAQESAQILAGVLHKEIEIHSQLADVYIPALAGKPLRFRYEIHDTGTDEYSEEWVKKGNESRSQVLARMLSKFKELLHNSKASPVLVSHGDPLSILLYSLIENQNEVPPIRVVINKGYVIKRGHGLLLKYDDDFKFQSQMLLDPNV